MADRKWKYVAGGTKEGEVDCSGAFTYWYKMAGSYMYHGSNTMWRNYAPKKGKIGELALVPGMAVYKHRNDGKEPDKYKGDGIGNFYHVGLYIGDGRVVEAKGTRYGVVYSDIDEWTHCSTLKYTVYDVENMADVDETNFPATGSVKISSGVLNVRKAPSTNSAIVKELKKGEMITLTGLQDGWYSIETGNVKGYVSSKYIAVEPKTDPARMVSFEVCNDAMLEEIIEYLERLGIKPKVTGD